MAELRSAVEKFAAFARSLHGDEKGEAQGFLERFFRALGHEEVMDDAKLERHYDQAFDHWTHIVPHRPPYVILCNFDEFWIYDFNQQLFDPVARVSLRELSDRASAFNFLLPQAQKPVFDNNRVEVTRKAAHNFGEVFRKITARGEDRTRAQRFILDEPGDNPLRTAHARLDTAVRAAFGMAVEKQGAATDPLAFLLAPNLELAAKDRAGEKITPPGLPLAEAERTAFVTGDCVRVVEPA